MVETINKFPATYTARIHKYTFKYAPNTVCMHGRNYLVKTSSQLLISHFKIIRGWPRNADSRIIPTGGDQFTNLWVSTTPTNIITNIVTNVVTSINNVSEYQHQHPLYIYIYKNIIHIIHIQILLQFRFSVYQSLSINSTHIIDK